MTRTPVSHLHANEPRGQHANSYYAATADQTLNFPRIEGDQRVELLVIGAGFCGLSAALHAANRGTDVAVIDAQRVGWGASGRNGGQLCTGQGVDQLDLEERLGKPRARELWELAEAAKSLVKTLIDEHAIDCEPVPGVMYAAHHQRYVADIREYVQNLRETYAHESVRFVDADEMPTVLGAKGYCAGALDMSAMHLHPLKLVQGLARAASAAGAAIFERSEALDVRPGAPAVVTLEHGTIRADRVVIACNGYAPMLNVDAHAHIFPLNAFIGATAPLSVEFARGLIPANCAVFDTRTRVKYFRLSPDNRMVFGGGESLATRFPDDIEAVVQKEMGSVFPQLSNTSLEYAWGGTLGITATRMPYIHQPHPSLAIAAGFSGHGVAMATLAGQLIAEEDASSAARLATPSRPVGAGIRAITHAANAWQKLF